MKLTRLSLTGTEKYTFKLHVAYSVLEGVILGALALNEFVFLKSLKGTDYNMGLLFLFSTAVMVFSLFFSEIVKRTLKKGRLLKWVAVATRLPLLLLVFFPENVVELTNAVTYHYIFLGIFLIYFFASPVTIPVVNLYLKQIYSHINFGSLYSYATSISRVVLLFTTFGFGIWLDYNPFAFRYVYPFLGILGIISVFIFTKIPYQEPVEKPVFKKGLLAAVSSSISEMKQVLKTNKPYRDFEIGFMLYGFAFMITVSVIKIFFEKVLELNYSSISLYLNLQVVMSIILLPFFGKMLGRIDPRKFAIITFSSLIFYILFIALSEFFPVHFFLWDFKIYYFLILSFIAYSVFAATNGLLWWIGSAYFCKPAEAGFYQSVHVSLTGIRALFAPLLGIFFYDVFGFFITFLVAIFSLLASVILMYISYRTEKQVI